MAKHCGCDNIQQNHVLFLGAGASKDAGYPLTNDLFGEVKNFCQTDAMDRSLKDTWDSFERKMIELCSHFHVNFEKQNPEIILTLPDLIKAVEDDFLDIADKDYSKGDGSTAKEYYKNLGAGVWSGSNQVQRQFSILVEKYFISKIHEICGKLQDNTAPRDYLLNMLGQANTVITTNWDALPEFVLYQLKRWNPADGYGFERVLRRLSTSGKSVGEQVRFPPSHTKLLKLHGSIGWHQDGKGKFYLRSDNFLQCILSNSYICDEDKPLLPRPPENEVMLYPSYLKQLENLTLLKVWGEAKKALETATSVTIVGYSLPKADVAIRALLLTLRNNKVPVEIVSLANKKSEERARWDRFFESSEVELIYSEMSASNRFADKWVRPDVESKHTDGKFLLPKLWRFMKSYISK